MHNILREIVQTTTQAVVRQKAALPQAVLEQRIEQRAPALRLSAVLAPGGCNIIAEIKFASPSKGVLRHEHDVEGLARAYTAAGAAAVSVLTEPAYFKGNIAYLDRARSVTDLPLLRKDFIIDAYQIYEARAHGADALLLIAALLDAASLARFITYADRLGMDCLVEVHTAEEIRVAVRAGARILGINNRDLTSFAVDPDCALRLAPLVPPEVPVVVESGIAGNDDILRYARSGLHNFLVGESLVRSDDPAAALRNLKEGV